MGPSNELTYVDIDQDCQTTTLTKKQYQPFLHKALVLPAYC